MADTLDPGRNEPITDERLALTNATNATIDEWIAEHPQVTREDIQWALLSLLGRHRKAT